MHNPQRFTFKALAFTILFLTSFMLPQTAYAQTGMTFNIPDGDVTGLIAAINAANTTGGHDTINLAQAGTYTLTAVNNVSNWEGQNGLPIITASSQITINGNGATIQRSSAEGTPSFRLFYNYGDLTLNEVTIKGGKSAQTYFGYIGGGGGIKSQGKLQVIKSTITENSGSDQGSSEDGGGILNYGGTLTVTNSTISHNKGYGGYGGGGILNMSYPREAKTTISNSTIYENQMTDRSSPGRGDAIADVFSPPGNVTLKNSIVASPTRGLGNDCYGYSTNTMATNSLGHNIYSDTSCRANTILGDQVVANLQLGFLSNNGGLTRTHALLLGSPAIDSVPLEFCTTAAGASIPTDQRGVARPQGVFCDIGAYEYNGDFTPPVITPTIDGQLSNDDWYTSDIGISWEVSDADSPVTSASGCELTYVTEDTLGVTFTCSATSGGGTATKSVTVKRDATAPTISNMPPNQTGEGTSANGATISWSAPSASDLFDGNVPVSCSPTSGSNFAVGTTIVFCSATDSHGNTSSATFSITILDTTAPIISNLPSNQTVQATSAAGAQVSWSAPTATDTVDGNIAVNCLPASGSTFARGITAVTCTAADSHNNTATGSFTVEVTNAPPTANAVGPYAVNEGGGVALSGNGSDPEGSALTYAWDLNNDGTFETAGQHTTFSAAGLDGPTSRTVRLLVTDVGGLTAMSTAIVNVANVAPTIVSLTGPVDPQSVNTTVNLSLNYTDPAGSLDQYTVATNWGDGSTDNNTSHVYTATGVYRVKVIVSDDDGGTSAEQVYEYIVVYDSSAGFVSGGGWIMSPAGAFTLNPALSGKATFGFVSKYQKGSNQPTGKTEFQFHAGDFRFNSDSYEWLVVAGAKAQYKGTGSVNGVSGYSFILTVTDGQINGGGGVDKFRIKILNAGGVVYDNVGGSDKLDEANPQAIAGGSIVIHPDR